MSLLRGVPVLKSIVKDDFSLMLYHRPVNESINLSIKLSATYTCIRLSTLCYHKYNLITKTVVVYYYIKRKSVLFNLIVATVIPDIVYKDTRNSN